MKRLTTPRGRGAWAVGLLLAACWPADPAAPPAEARPMAPTRAPAEPPAADELAPMTGVLVPHAEVVLVASGLARLERLDVQVGDRVSEGEVVAEMNVRGERTELAAATAAWKASQAELDRLALELQQAEEARADVEQIERFIAKAELREQRYAEKLAAARKRSAGASLQQQRTRMKEAATRIADAELRAPFSGAVTRRYVDPGATLSPGDPVVKLISDARRIRFAVPEARSRSLHPGAMISVRFVEDELSARAEITTIAPEIEAGTRLILAEAQLVPSTVQDRAPRVGAVAEIRFEHP